MAVSLALLTGAVWIALALAALIGRCRRAEASWDLWDAMRGAGVPAVLRSLADWLASLDLLGEGHQLARRATAAGDTRSGASLIRAELASAQALLDQLELDLIEGRRQARVLQVVTDVPPLDSVAPGSRALRRLWGVQRALHACLGLSMRLRLRIGILHASARLVRRRLMRAARQPLHIEPAVARGITADVAALTRAVAASRNALLGSWVASRARLGFGSLERENGPAPYRHVMQWPAQPALSVTLRRRES